MRVLVQLGFYWFLEELDKGLSMIFIVILRELRGFLLVLSFVLVCHFFFFFFVREKIVGFKVSGTF